MFSGYSILPYRFWKLFFIVSSLYFPPVTLSRNSQDCKLKTLLRNGQLPFLSSFPLSNNYMLCREADVWMFELENLMFPPVLGLQTCYNHSTIFCKRTRLLLIFRIFCCFVILLFALTCWGFFVLVFCLFVCLRFSPIVNYSEYICISTCTEANPCEAAWDLQGFPLWGGDYFCPKFVRICICLLIMSGTVDFQGTWYLWNMRNYNHFHSKTLLN